VSENNSWKYNNYSKKNKDGEEKLQMKKTCLYVHKGLDLV